MGFSEFKGSLHVESLSGVSGPTIQANIKQSKLGKRLQGQAVINWGPSGLVEDWIDLRSGT